MKMREVSLPRLKYLERLYGILQGFCFECKQVLVWTTDQVQIRYSVGLAVSSCLFLEWRVLLAMDGLVDAIQEPKFCGPYLE